MSISILTTRQLGLFVAVQIKSKMYPPEKLMEACEVAELISQSNVAAYRDSFAAEPLHTPATADDIEREALFYLADKTGLITADSTGAIIANLVSRSGQMFIGSREIDAGDEEARQIVLIKKVEDAVHQWQQAEARRIARQVENDAAYTEVGPLPLESTREIAARCMAQGCARVIVATYHVDESDPYTDYFGGRTSRHVVIGFGKGKRESFKQLREAAAQFEPTKHLGPKCGRFQAMSVWDHDSTDTEACEKSQFQDQHGLFYKGWRSRFSDSPVFVTQAELDAWIAANPLGLGNSYERCGGIKSIEHRENYSMGGGNYLGYHRYSGWTVSSTPASYFTGLWRYEVLHSAPTPEPEVIEQLAAEEPALEPDQGDLDATDWL